VESAGKNEEIVRGEYSDHLFSFRVFCMDQFAEISDILQWPCLKKNGSTAGSRQAKTFLPN
jgi:hypothetical protein